MTVNLQDSGDYQIDGGSQDYAGGCTSDSDCQGMGCTLYGCTKYCESGKCRITYENVDGFNNDFD